MIEFSFKRTRNPRLFLRVGRFVLMYWAATALAPKGAGFQTCWR